MKKISAGIFLSLILSILAIACSDKGSSLPPLFPLVPNEYTAFSNPQVVTINAYSGDAMEPFVSSNGSYLFFNTNGGGATDKDIHYATFNGTTFDYSGPIAAINSSAVDGVPTMDAENNFFFVSLFDYDGNTKLNTLYKGTWNGSTVINSITLSLTLASPLLYFDVEVSRDGSTLYLSVGAFTGDPFPAAADIHIAVASGGGFTLAPNSASIMANVNTADKLEYASAISSNGLEFFFTRLDLNTGQARIYRAVRAHAGSAFGAPQLVSAITGFVEGPALSPDERSLYYHRLNTNTNKFEIYRVTRP